MIEVQEYVGEDGRSAFASWFDGLNQVAAIKVAVALERIAQGHTSAMKAVGEGVVEYKIDFGPGYRIYFGRDRERMVILIGGGTKQRQQRDIASAKMLWKRYKQQKMVN